MKKKVEARDLAIQEGRPVRETMLVFGRPDVSEAEAAAVAEVVRSRWIGVGPKVAEFEKQIKEFIGAKTVVSTNSSSAALHIALLASDVGKGDEVITSPITFPSTVNMIENVGAKPVFADVDPDTGLITPELISKVITEKTKVIVPVHLYGRPCDMRGIYSLAKKHHIVVIEDAAEAFGAQVDGEKIGAKSDYAAFSFAVNKLITTGEGGVLVSNIEGIDSKLRRYILHGMDKGALKKYPYKGYTEHFVELPGFKYNMTDLHAAIGLVQLKRIEELLSTRDEIAQMYNKGLADLPVKVPPEVTGGMRHGRCFYAIQLELEKLSADRDVIQEALLAENIGSAVHFYPMHLQPYYSRKYGYKKGCFPQAEFFSDRTLSLPFSTDMTVRDVVDVISALRKILSYFSRR